MKVIWGDESDYDENGNPKPEAIRRAMEHKKPLPWYRVLGILWVVGTVAVVLDKTTQNVFSMPYTGAVFGAVVVFAFLWANSESVRRITRRFLGWLVP